MAEFTFKQFNKFVSMETEPTDEQITEIFGVFRNNDKLDKLKKTRQELTLAQKADREKKDAMMKAAAMRARGQKPDEEEKKPGSNTARAQNARDRGNEYSDWRVAEGKQRDVKVDDEVQFDVNEIFVVDKISDKKCYGHLKGSSKIKSYPLSTIQEYFNNQLAEGKSSLADDVHNALDNAKDNEMFEKGGDLYGKDAFAIAQDLIEFDASLEKHTAVQLIRHVETWMDKNDIKYQPSTK